MAIRRPSGLKATVEDRALARQRHELLTAGDVEDETVAVHGPDAETRTVGTEREVNDGTTGGEEWRPVGGAGGGVVEDDRAVVATGDEPLAVGAERGRVDRGRMPAEREVDRLTRVDIPDVDGFGSVHRARVTELSLQGDEPLAVGTEGQA